MKVHLVSYATTKYRHRQIFLSASARANGIVCSSTSWTPARLVASEFPKLAPNISLAERGSGFWAWKPFIILKTLESIPEGETVLYCDAGRKYPYILLNTPLDSFLSWMDEKKQDIMPGISIPWSGSMSVWTKHDAFIGTGVDGENVRRSWPIQASFSLWRNNSATQEFVCEWLSWCIQRQLISDDPSVGTISEASEFKAHRHDQSLLNLCCYKHGIKGIDIGTEEPSYNERDPSQILKHVFDVNARNTMIGNVLAFLAKPIQATEQTLRKQVTFGQKYE